MKLSWKIVPWLCLAGLAALSIALIVLPLRLLFEHIPLSYNEGWNAFHTARLMAGGPLYPPVASGQFINYPPLSFYVVGLLGKLVGDNIFAGRILALVSLYIVTLNVGLAAAAAGVPRVLAAISALLFLVFAQIYFADYIAVDEPQWFGHVFQSAALVLLLRRSQPENWRQLILPAVLLLIGGLVKQNLVALPLAVTIWIAFIDRRLLLQWLAICAAAIAGAALFFFVLYGGRFFEQVVAQPRYWTTEVLAWAYLYLGARITPFIGIGALGSIVGWREPRWRLLLLYLGCGTIVGIGMMGAEGVIYNALFDCLIAAMLTSALFVDWTGRWAMSNTVVFRRSGQALTILALTAPGLLVAPHSFDNYGPLFESLGQAPGWKDSIAQIAAAPGDVACEDLSLCYWAGRQSAIEFFNFGQYIRRHPEAEAAFAEAVNDRRLALIQKQPDVRNHRLPPALDEAIARNYTATQVEPTILLTPTQKVAVSAPPSP